MDERQIDWFGDLGFVNSTRVETYIFVGRITKEILYHKKKKNYKGKKTQTRLQPGTSSFNTDFNFKTKVCQNITLDLKERPSLAKKTTQHFPSLNKCWKEMLRISYFKPNIFTNMHMPMVWFLKMVEDF